MYLTLVVRCAQGEAISRGQGAERSGRGPRKEARRGRGQGQVCALGWEGHPEVPVQMRNRVAAAAQWSAPRSEPCKLFAVQKPKVQKAISKVFYIFTEYVLAEILFMCFEGTLVEHSLS